MADVDDVAGIVPSGDDSYTPAFPPGLFVEDGEVPPLPPPPPPEPVTPPAPVAPAKEPPKKKRALLITCIVLVVVVAVVVTLVLVFQPWKSTSSIEQNFTDAVARYQQSQTALATAIADGESTLAIKADVADPTTTDRLSSALADARSRVGSPPAMAGNRSQIEEQTTQLTNQSAACDTAVATLDTAIQDVTKSRVQYATDRLGEAVASAQMALDQSKGTADESARTALAIAIGRTQAIISGLSTADPATFADTITEQQASLQQASQAVLGAQGMVCDNGVEVPIGINPMVCNPMPATAVQTVTSGGTTPATQFSMPSGNVGCTKDPYGSGMICEIIRKDWTLPSSVVPTCAANASCGAPEAAIQDGVVTAIRHSDIAPWASNMNDSSVTVPILEYGQVADFSPVACLSDQNGVTCWDTTTHHGFQMSVTWFLYW